MGPTRKKQTGKTPVKDRGFRTLKILRRDIVLMKSKKLFAILTLMAFMMTLLPMAAFAAYDADANHHASKVDVDTDTADADNDDEAELNVYLFKSNGAPVEGKQTIYVFSERGEIDLVYYENSKGEKIEAPKVLSVDKATDKYEKDTVLSYEITVEDGDEDIYIRSSVVGSAKIAVALNPNVKAYWDGKDDYEGTNDIRLIGSPEVTFVTAEPQELEFYKAEGKGSAQTATPANLGHDGTDKKDPITFADKDTPMANGIEYYELYVRSFTDKNKVVPAKGEEVEFSCSSSDVRFSSDTDETDSFGVASTKIYATKTGVYKISVECGDADKDFYVRFGAPELYSVELASAPDPKIALDDSTATVKLRLFDAQGQELDVDDTEGAKKIFSGKVDGSEADEKDDIDVDVITAPKDKDEEDFKYDVTADAGLLKIVISDDKSSKGFKEEGTYEFKFSLSSGRYVTTKFEVVEQGEVVRLSLEYDQSNLPLEGTSSKPTVKRYDADDVSVELGDNHSDITFSVNKIAVLHKDFRDINDSGRVTKEVEDGEDEVLAKGQFMVTDDDAYVGEELVITAVDTDNDLTASYTITIGNVVNGFEVSEGAAEVGKDAEVTVQLIDENGNKVAFGDDVSTVDFDSYVLSKPAGAAVSCDEVSGFSTDLIEDGFSTVRIKSNKAGEAKVQFVLTAKNKNTGNDTVYTGTATAKFGAAVDNTLGAKAVTMFIGNTGYVQDGAVKTTDVAPFINPENNRTYVAVRPLGEAFGAEVDYDNTTKTATFTRPDMVVSITIGSNVITKVADGVTTTTEIDAPAFIKDGRTVLPFRAVGEAFGYKVNYDANTRAVSFTK